MAVRGDSASRVPSQSGQCTEVLNRARVSFLRSDAPLSSALMNRRVNLASTPSNSLFIVFSPAIRIAIFSSAPHSGSCHSASE